MVLRWWYAVIPVWDYALWDIGKSCFWDFSSKLMDNVWTSIVASKFLTYKETVSNNSLQQKKLY